MGIKPKGEFALPLADMKLRYNGIYMNGLKGPDRTDRQVTDNNANKMLGGRLGLVPIDGLEVGGYYATSKYDADSQLELPFLGTYLIYERGDLDIRGEYIESDVERASGVDLKRQGYYLQAAYKLFRGAKYLNYLEPKVRFDKIILGKSNNTDRTRWAAGVNISPYKHFLFKLEYQWIRETHPPQLKNNSVLFEVVMDF